AHLYFFIFFFSSRRRHTRCYRDWSSDVCSSDLLDRVPAAELISERHHLAVDLGAAAAIADLSVDGVCEIDGRRALHQLLHCALEIGRASCRERVYIAVALETHNDKRKTDERGL